MPTVYLAGCQTQNVRKHLILFKMDQDNSTKTYTNGEITIVWQAAKCQHSANCVKNSPDVFNSKEKPWIKPEGSSTEKIKNTIDKCPSGALTYFFNKG